MWKAALNLDALLRPTVDAAVRSLVGDDVSRAKVVIAGHSLGAGVGALLASLWRFGPASRRPLWAIAGDHSRNSSRSSSRNSSNNDTNLRCLAFGCPCVLEPRVATSEEMRALVTSVVNGDDMVCRWSLASSRDLQEMIRAVALEATTSTEADRARVFARARAAAASRPGRELLLPPGRALHYKGAGRLEQVPNAQFSELVLSWSSFASHLPLAYEEGMDAAATAAAASASGVGARMAFSGGGSGATAAL